MIPEKFKFYLKVSLSVYAIWIIVFEAVGWYANTLPAKDITSFVDRKIPLIPEFIWPYLLCYVFPLLPLFVIKDWHRFNRALLSIIVANLSAYIVYLTFPVAFPRPELGQGISEWLLSFEYAIDFYPGANKLPSLHVIFAWIVFLACRGQRLNKFGDVLIFLIAVVISISALFVKQHILIDVVAGILWAFAAWILAGYIYRSLVDSKMDPMTGFRQMVRKLIPLVFIYSIIACFVVLL